jgi:L-alanine-DL-glutamate epimerase-like enolase superfamily enzyme
MPTIEDITVSAYQVPTDKPESDGTLAWDSTTIILVEAAAGGETGIGYTYANKSTASFIQSALKNQVTALDCFDIPEAWRAMKTAVRNEGHCGVAFMAISAVDCALWDLKAKVLDLPLVKLIGAAREGMPVYGSGGFTSYSISELQEQLENWVDEGINRVKMKVGRHPEKDVQRVQAAREAIGPEAKLFIDANGAYSTKQALDLANKFAEYSVCWMEEPVSSDNLIDLNFIKNRVPAGMDIAAGEYGYQLFYFEDMLRAQAVDVLQADGTRCGGITGFLRAGTVAKAWHMPFSAHCAPSLHFQAAPALPNFRHAEYFHDHVRIEKMFFDGFCDPVDGVMKPDLDRPGLGLEFKHQDAKEYKIG